MQIVWPSPSSKIMKISIAIFIMTGIIVIRLFYLQITLSDFFIKQGKKNFLHIEKIPSPRGNIIDKNGLFLATNRPTIDLYWQGSGNNSITADQYKTLTLLEAILSTPLIENEQLMNAIKTGERRHRAIPIAFDMPFEHISKIEEQLSNNSNILLRSSFKRFYPFNSYASHIVGYLGNFDFKMVGKMGLEQLFEPMLQGEQGIVLKTINSLGRNLSQQEIKQSLAGSNIQVTLDITLQGILEEVFPQEYRGTFVVMDSYDGGIVGMVSRPNFDPALFLEHMKTEHWQQLQEKQPFLNRAFNACYPPGSIFKLITISAALEHNIITPDTCWNCKGYVSFAGRKYWCNNRNGHGELSTQAGLAKSCNTMFFEIGKQVPIDLLADYAQRFGLGQPTHIIFPEKTGLIPSMQWKIKTKGERWWPGETLSATIGQSYLLVTPIQIARMISSIFTGYLVTPRILTSEPVIKQPLAIAQSTRDFLQESMRSVVQVGTGRGVNTVKDIEIYAKTSTAQTSTYNKRCLGSIYLEHGWFVAYFKYKNNKPLTLVILVEHAGSSRVAKDIAKQFLIKYKKLAEKLVAQ